MSNYYKALAAKVHVNLCRGKSPRYFGWLHTPRGSLMIKSTNIRALKDFIKAHYATHGDAVTAEIDSVDCERQIFAFESGRFVTV